METLTDVYIEHDCKKSLHVGFIADVSSEVQRLKINNSFTDGVSNYHISVELECISYIHFL